MLNACLRPSVWASCIAICASLCTSACSSSDDEDAPDCTIVGKNKYVQSLMKDAYFWYDKVPDLDPEKYDSPEALMDALAYRSIDRWSYVTQKATHDAYYEQGTTLGFGYRWKRDANNDVRFSFVHVGSPADEAGIRRGDKVVGIAGLTIAQIDAQEQWESVLGADKAGVSVTFTIEDSADVTVDKVLEKKPYNIKTVPTTNVFDVGTNKVGYLVFTNFLEISEPELLNAFASFKADGVNELILDLRYNGGGLLRLAQVLGSLVGGKKTDAQVFSANVHNAKHHDWDKKSSFEPQASSLNLSRVFVLTTRSTASASETLINGLRPYVEVLTIGSTTAGKPVGMYSWDYCDITAVPIAFEVQNAMGMGGYFDGLAPDCPADDDLMHPLGDIAEATLAEAIHRLETGTCSAQNAFKSAAAPGQDIPMNGFRREIGSY